MGAKPLVDFIRSNAPQGRTQSDQLLCARFYSDYGVLPLAIPYPPMANHRIQSTAFERVLFDPRLWAGLLFVAGLFYLDLPYLGDHAPRQTGTATIARNFYELSFNPFYPTSNICGEIVPDYFATEFPLMQTISVFFYYVFGEQYWIGRLINWTVSCVGLVYFALLAGLLSEGRQTVRQAERIGLFAMLLLIGSITTTFMRKMMPDTFSLFLAVAGTYYLYVYLRDGQRNKLLVGGLLVGLGVLSKIPALVVVTLLAVPFVDGAIGIRRKGWVTAVLGIAGLLTAGWYFVWMPHLQGITTCPPLIYPVSLREGFDVFMFEMHEKSIRRFRDIAFCGSYPFWLFLTSLVITLFRREWKLLAGTLAYIVLFLLFVFKTGKVFPTHNYYVIPFIPLMAFYCGKFLEEQLTSKWIGLGVALALTVMPLRYAYDDLQLGKKAPELRLEKILDQTGSDRDDKVMINGGWMDPAPMFFAHRRGFFAEGATLDQHNWMPDYRRMGVRRVVVDKRIYDKPLPYKLLYEDEVYQIYDNMIDVPLME